MTLTIDIPTTRTTPLPIFDTMDTRAESLRSDLVSVGTARTIEEQLGRLNVVTDRYRGEGYLNDVQMIDIPIAAADIIQAGGHQILQQQLCPDLYTEFLRHGLVIQPQEGDPIYIDKYHWCSIPVVATTTKGCIGSARIIVPETGELPTLNDPDITIYPEWYDRAKNTGGEFSQFAVRRGSTRAHASLGILRAAVRISRSFGLFNWVATTDEAVYRMLNGTGFHFGIPQIGPPVDYLGSRSIPNYIDIGSCIENASRHPDSLAMSKFINGDPIDPQTFGWYVGK